MAKFSLGEPVRVQYIDAVNKPLGMQGVIHRGPLGEEPYWYVKIGGIAVLFPEKDISHEESSQGQDGKDGKSGQGDGGVQTGNAA